MRAWRSPSPAVLGDPAVVPFLEAIRIRDYAGALVLAEALEVPRSRELAMRLARDLTSVRAKRGTAPPLSD